MHNKILGCIVGAATGDAMGAATEVRSIKQIHEYFGGDVKDFYAPPQDTYGRCNSAGMCTDDFIQAKYIMDELIANKGQFSDEVMKKAFRRWLDYPFYPNFTGPSTRAAMKKIFSDTRASLQESVSSSNETVEIINNGNFGATNGASMKIWPAALMSLNNRSKLIKNTYEITKFTHNNVLSVSGASAVAGAVLTSFDTNELTDVFEAALRYAHDGYKLAQQQGAIELAGPSVIKRMELAIRIGEQFERWEDAVVEIADVIGCGIHISEAVPAVFGILACCGNNPNESIYAGVNAGDDTDTIATMVGAIVGTLHGADALESRFITTIDDVNQYDLKQYAEQVEKTFV
ncbi:ADP-ribosylglycohydrolase family protein [Photobacterium satsumensis]|uniref:ADP-ribosylglycohydrolase family protein n=1 Tax=Photobacterium satsumensis TaxID=2910239 RepID=UPI003D0EC9BA